MKKKIKLYSFNKVGVFVGSREKTIKPGIVGLPPNTTDKKPPLSKEGERAVFDGKAWNIEAIPEPVQEKREKRKFSDEAMPAALIAAGKVIKGLVKIHQVDGKNYFGVASSDVEAALSAEGLKPDDYGFMMQVDGEWVVNEYQLMMLLFAVGEATKPAEKEKTNNGKKPAE